MRKPQSQTRWPPPTLLGAGSRLAGAAAGVALALATAGLAGCGGGTGDSAEADADAAAEDIPTADGVLTDASSADVTLEDALPTDSSLTGGPPLDGAGDTGLDGAAGDAGLAGDGDGDSDAPPKTLAAALTCTPAASPCADLPTAQGIFASYRKDRYLPDEQYQEYTEYPVDGGRLHIAGIATVGGAVTDVRIGGVSVTELLAPPSPSIEWHHVWPDPVVAGEPVWVALHSRDPWWDTASTATVTIETSAGLALDGELPVAITPVPLTYVTVSDARTERLIHLHNDDSVAHELTALRVDGRDVLVGGVACVADPLIAPGSSLLVSVPLCEAAPLGSAWTVVASFEEGVPPAVGVGRTLKPHFIIEAWPSGGDCVAPAADGDALATANYLSHVDAGFDTLYLYWGASQTCPYKTAQLVNAHFPSDDLDIHALIGDDFLSWTEAASALQDTSAVAGFLTGDESDGEVYLEDGSPKAAVKAAQARALWSMYPELTVYNGAMTNGHVGTFAGMVDVQGIDAYSAACAPHITEFGVPRPFTAPHDYLRNARDNQMPGPTWLYSQGLHSGWNGGGGDDTIHVQPDPQELLAQAFMTLTAGAKGLMWFQTTLSEAHHAPERWIAIAQANWMIRSVRQHLREGDVTGAVTSSAGGKTLVEAIRAPRAIVVPVVNTDPLEAVDDLACLQMILDLVVPHWQLQDIVTDLQVAVPADFEVVDVFEVGLDLAVHTPAYHVDPQARRVHLDDVSLSNDMPVRLLVIAADNDVRAEAAAELARGRAVPARSP